MQQYEVIIIGGGAAGMVAAKMLSEGNKKILLLEARNSLGGRIRSVDNFSIGAEEGAEFIHGNLKTTFNLLNEAGLKKAKIKGEFCRVEQGHWKVYDDIVPHWDSLLKKMKARERDITVADFLQKEFHAKKYDRLRMQFAKYVEGYDAADTKNTSLFAIRDEMVDEDEEQYRPLPDYTALIRFLQEKSFNAGAIISTGEPVLKVNMTTNVEVTTTKGKYEAEKVVIAVPLGVLQCRASSEAFIKFPPCLKSHLLAAGSMGNGGVIKFLFEFNEAFWLKKGFLKLKNIPPASYIFSDTAVTTWWTQYPSLKPLLVGWIGGAPTNKMKTFSEKKLTKLAIDALSGILSMSTTEINNRLKASRVVNWMKEPYILGGYSYPTLASKRAGEIIRQPVMDTFYFAGEYAAENSLSTVDAALQSGEEVARKILNE
jgi:monoamine oxidase